MDKLQEVIENLEHAKSMLMAKPARNNAEARIDDGILEQLDFNIDRYQFQLRKLQSKEEN